MNNTELCKIIQDRGGWVSDYPFAGFKGDLVEFFYTQETKYNYVLTLRTFMTMTMKSSLPTLVSDYKAKVEWAAVKQTEADKAKQAAAQAFKDMEEAFSSLGLDVSVKPF